MRHKWQVLGFRLKGKTKARFLHSLTPSTWHRAPDSRGFTLIEMVVSVALFAVIMLVAMGALLALVDANRKARAIESVMNNLNISLDSMVRAIRMGTHYNCGSSAIPSEATGGDCPGGFDPPGTPALFSFAPYGSDPALPNERTTYSFSEGRIYRSLNNGEAIAVTAPEVNIEEMQLYLLGSQPGDTTQPKVVIVIKGSTGDVGSRLRTEFYVQATAVQRALDI